MYNNNQQTNKEEKMDKDIRKAIIKQEQEQFKNTCKVIIVACICVTLILIACIIRDCVTKGM